jgi:hypothetical protein
MSSFWEDIPSYLISHVKPVLYAKPVFLLAPHFNIYVQQEFGHDRVTFRVSNMFGKNIFPLLLPFDIGIFQIYSIILYSDEECCYSNTSEHFIRMSRNTAYLLEALSTPYPKESAWDGA